MADITNVLKILPDVSEMLYQMYKDETDRESISVRYDQFLAVDDAIELLKEQQPRVLTYDEMKTMIGKPVYVEEPKRNADPHCYWGIVVEGEEPPKEGGYNYPGGVDFNVEVGLDTYDGDLYMVDIGCGWRAWTAEPTDDQRMDTPWEGR